MTHATGGRRQEPPAPARPARPSSRTAAAQEAWAGPRWRRSSAELEKGCKDSSCGASPLDKKNTETFPGAPPFLKAKIMPAPAGGPLAVTPNKAVPSRRPRLASSGKVQPPAEGGGDTEGDREPPTMQPRNILFASTLSMRPLAQRSTTSPRRVSSLALQWSKMRAEEACGRLAVLGSSRHKFKELGTR